jgi:hypothetical protein
MQKIYKWQSQEKWHWPDVQLSTLQANMPERSTPVARHAREEKWGYVTITTHRKSHSKVWDPPLPVANRSMEKYLT